jgi:purine nucleosidase
LLKERSVNVIGFTTVNGNTSVPNATNNLLTLFDVIGTTKPVTIGAAVPLQVPASHVGQLIHGPSGIWFSQTQHDLTTLPTDAPAAIAAAARANPGMTLLTLGPLTNVAEAVRRFPRDLVGVKIIALAGSRGPGNRTPVAETNVFIDPQASEIVFGSSLNLTMITLDAFQQVTVDSADFTQQLTSKGGQLGQFLASIFGPYSNALTQGQGGLVALPDVAAAVYAAQPSVGTPTSGLVRIVTNNDYTRGQTIIAVDLTAKIGLVTNDAQLSGLADQVFTTPNFNLFFALAAFFAQNPDNAQVVLDVYERPLIRQFERRILSNNSD